MQSDSEIERLAFRLDSTSIERIEEIRASAKRIYPLGIDSIASGETGILVQAFQSMYDHVDHLLSLRSARG